MTTPISDRDWEAISAYLDGELNPKERARLDARLQANADLRAALEDLRRTRTVLRSQPRLHAPRNFTSPRRLWGRSGSAARRCACPQYLGWFLHLPAFCWWWSLLVSS